MKYRVVRRDLLYIPEFHSITWPRDEWQPILLGAGLHGFGVFGTLVDAVAFIDKHKRLPKKRKTVPSLRMFEVR